MKLNSFKRNSLDCNSFSKKERKIKNPSKSPRINHCILPAMDRSTGAHLFWHRKASGTAETTVFSSSGRSSSSSASSDANPASGGPCKSPILLLFFS